MDFLRHQRLHLTQGGRFLGYNPETRAEESFDLFAECRADNGTAAGEIMARHLADGGRVTTEAFSVVRGEETFKPKERKLLEARAKVINGRNTVDFDRTLRFVWSRETPNRSRIVVPNNSWNLEPFNLNPVGLWNHQSGGGPQAGMARWLHVGHKTSSENSDLIGFPEFATHETNPLTTMVLGLYREGVFSAVSPGFLIGSVEFKDDDELIIFGSKEDQNELVEQSFTPVPRHKDALTFALEAGTVELSAFRDLITYQLEAAYSDPMQVMETAQLEAWAAKLGIQTQQFAQMSTEDIEAHDLPGHAEATLEETTGLTDLEMANALRTRDAKELDVDANAWARFMAAIGSEDKGTPGEIVRLVALSAGLVDEAAALGRVLVIEAENAGDAGSDAEDNAAGDGEDSTAGADDPEGNGLDAEGFRGLIKAAMGPIAKTVGRTTGRLVIPAE